MTGQTHNEREKMAFLEERYDVIVVGAGMPVWKPRWPLPEWGWRQCSSL